MQTVTVLLNSMEKVKGFVETISRFESDFDMRSGRYNIDAKSIMGIFSLDLAKPIDLDIYNEDEMPLILEAIKPFKAP